MTPPASVDTSTQNDLFTRFTDRLGAVGGHVELVSESDRLSGRVVQLAGDLGIAPASTVWMSRELREAMPSLAASLESAGYPAQVPANPADARDATLGLAVARAAIAETGSVLLVEPDVAQRAVTLVTQTLIVVCPLGALIPSLDEAAAILRDLTGNEASYMTFVTGPSRTADIERELTVGVQGPGRLHVVFVATRSS